MTAMDKPLDETKELQNQIISIIMNMSSQKQAELWQELVERGYITE